MFEVFVHVVLVCAWLNVVRSPNAEPATWVLMFLALFVAVLSAASIVFLLPAIYVTLLWKVWVQRTQGQRWICGAFAGHAAFVGFLFLYVWSHGSDKELID